MILRACFVVILKNFFNFFNILKFISFKVLEKLKTLLWTPHFGSMRFPLDGETRFLVWKWFYLLKRVDLESPLIFVLFLKG